MRTRFTSNRSILGVDIGRNFVKIIQLFQSTHRYCVQGYGRLALPSGVMDGHVIKDVEAAASCVKELLAIAQFRGQHAILAVPDAATISKIIPVPLKFSDQEIEEKATIEAESFIPYPLDDIRIDFTILGASEQQALTRDVLIVGTRADIVNSRVETVRSAGLQVEIVEVESFAILRALDRVALPLGSQKPITVVDMGALFTRLLVFSEGRLLFSREEAFGGQELIRQVAEHYAMTMDEAMQNIERGTLLLEDAIVSSFREALLLHVSRALQFFAKTTHAVPIDCLRLIGGVAKLSGITAYFEEQLKIPTRLVNPLMHMAIAEGVDRESLLLDMPMLLGACGLALRFQE